MEKAIVFLSIALLSSIASAQQEIIVGKVLNAPLYLNEVQSESGEFFHGSWFTTRFVIEEKNKKRTFKVRFTAPSETTLKRGMEIWGVLRTDQNNDYFFERWGYVVNLKCLMNTQDIKLDESDFNLKLPFKNTQWKCREQH